MHASDMQKVLVESSHTNISTQVDHVHPDKSLLVSSTYSITHAGTLPVLSLVYLPHLSLNLVRGSSQQLFDISGFIL